MTTITKKAKLSSNLEIISEFQIIMKNNDLETTTTKLKLSKFSKITLNDLILFSIFDAPYDCFIECILFHIRKKKICYFSIQQEKRIN